MTAIFKRETKSYFTGMIGYVVIAVLVAFIGLYYSANCLVYGSPDFSSVLYSTTIAMLFVLPALSMRSFADERRNKTDQLLLTSPITIPQIVLGKYLAQLAVFALPMLLACLLPLLLSAFGEVLLAGAYATLLAYFLLGAACIAVGTFVSVLTENQIIAYLATFGLLLVSYLMEDIQTLFTTGSTMAFIIFSIALVVIAVLVGLVCKSLTVGCGTFCDAPHLAAQRPQQRAGRAGPVRPLPGFCGRHVQPQQHFVLSVGRGAVFVPDRPGAGTAPLELSKGGKRL